MHIYSPDGDKAVLAEIKGWSNEIALFSSFFLSLGVYYMSFGFSLSHSLSLSLVLTPSLSLFLSPSLSLSLSLYVYVYVYVNVFICDNIRSKCLSKNSWTKTRWSNGFP